jgi:N-acetylglucosamine-6-sulfatase
MSAMRPTSTTWEGRVMQPHLVAGRRFAGIVLALLAALAISVSAMAGSTKKSQPPPPAAVVGGPMTQHDLPADRPNVVFIIADDQAAQDEALVQMMPTVKDVFADHGVSFSDFHSESPLCCPARAGFFTGQHTHNHGVDQNNAGLFNPAMTIATQLQAAGYYTGLVFKYMNGYGNSKTCYRKDPLNCAPTIPVGWNAWDAVSDPAYWNYTQWHGLNLNNGTSGTATSTDWGDSTNPNNYSGRQVTNWATAQIAAAPAGQPLFQWVAYYNPHAPTTPDPQDTGLACNLSKWFPPNYNELDVSDKPQYVQNVPLMTGTKATGQNRKSVCQALQSVDRGVAAIRAAILAKYGQAGLDNTLFVYMGDNGMNAGEHRLSDKQAPYETQIPFYMSWPAMWGSTPYTINERVQNIDVAPTLCDIVGCSMGPYPNGQQTPDGISFKDLMTAASQTLPRDAVLDEMPAIKSVGTFDIPTWEAVTTTSSSSLANVGCAPLIAMGNGCRWHLIQYATGEEELYDVSNGPCYTWTSGGDPCELNNDLNASDGSLNIGRILANGDDPVAMVDVKSQLEVRLAQLEVSAGQPQ